MARHRISFAVKYSTALPISASDIIIQLYELSDTLQFHITELRSSNRYEVIHIDMKYKCQRACARTIAKDIVKAMGPLSFDWEIYK